MSQTKDSFVLEKQDKTISYSVSRLIKITEFSDKDKISYLIKTFLEIINRWNSVEVHILTLDNKDNKDNKR